jgi:hypothetical protein
MMLVEDRVTDRPEDQEIPLPDAGVIEDARSRQQRQRRGVAAVLAFVFLAGVVYSLVGGGAGGGGPPSAPLSRGDASNVTNASVRLTRGQTSSVITIDAPADHAYDVTLRTPAGATVLLATNFGSPGPRFNTLADRQVCHTKAASTTCIIHFAAGGNAGGTWRWKLTKFSTPPADVHIRVVFAVRAGDYPG